MPKKLTTIIIGFLTVLELIMIAPQTLFAQPLVQYQTAPSRIFNLEKAKNKLELVIELLENHLGKTRTKIENLHKLDNQTKSQLLSLVDERLGVLIKLKVEIGGSTKLDDLKVIAQKIHQFIDELKNEVKKQMGIRLQKH